MVAGLLKKKNHIFITKRWGVVAGILYFIPQSLLRKFM
jgi:hypothetical protein